MPSLEKVQSKVSAQTRYALGVTLNKAFCRKLGIGARDTVEQFLHPTMRRVICIRKKRD